jgi:hypothetical protein
MEFFRVLICVSTVFHPWLNFMTTAQVHQSIIPLGSMASSVYKAPSVYGFISPSRG